MANVRGSPGNEKTRTVRHEVFCLPSVCSSPGSLWNAAARSRKCLWRDWG